MPPSRTIDAEPAFASSDEGLLEVLRQRGPQGVDGIAKSLGVTATAVRQRLGRLMAEKLIERETVKHERGRPSHRYRLTDAGRRSAGDNFADLAVVLWDEIRSVADLGVRRGLMKRLAERLAERYRHRVSGNTPAARTAAVAELLRERDISCTAQVVEGETDASDGLPVLTMHSCPYPDLAEQDRGVCSLEKMMLAELIDGDVKLTDCRLDGASCCTFQTS